MEFTTLNKECSEQIIQQKSKGFGIRYYICYDFADNNSINIYQLLDKLET